MVDVVGRVDIQPTVAIKVDQGNRGRPLVILDPRRLADIGKCPVLSIQVNPVGTKVADIKVGVAVVVEIPDGHAHPESGVTESAALGHVFKPPLLDLPKQAIDDPGIGTGQASCIELPAVEQEQIQVAVAIEIEQRHTRCQ